MYVCICNAITERQVRECARQGARSVEDLACALGVGAGCGRCRESATDVLREACDESRRSIRLVPSPA